MKNRTIVLLAVLLALCSAGISAVVPLAKEDRTEEKAEKDRLIGVYVTTEYVHLTDMEQYIEDNIGDILNGNNILAPDDTAAYTAKLYGEVREEEAVSPVTGETYTTHDLVFPGLEGFSAYCFTAVENGSPLSISGGLSGISERHLGLTSTDYGQEMTLTGTIYTEEEYDRVLYFNPIYQSGDGRFYLLPGTGIHTSGTGKSSYNMNEKNTAEVNGETVTVDSTDITIHIESVQLPETVTLVQFSADHRVLDRTDYSRDALPACIVLAADAAFAVAEHYTADGETVIMRILYTDEADDLDVFVPLRDGVCEKKAVELVWD
ncbi:MAG: hypothetical protein E7658_01970 [Ruminococcaceae bacterium]|nr:hypothetical protein [Oscillospiraceae bacterium]